MAATHFHLHLVSVCEERKQLRATYGRAVSLHGRAVSEVIAVRGKVSKEEYDRVRALSDKARNARTVARLALDLHKREHGC